MTQILKDPHVEALERQIQMLRSAIKETWKFIKYDLPLSIEIEVAKQESQTKVTYNKKVFKPLLDIVLNETVKILQETCEPVHYTLIVELVKQKHRAYLDSEWTKDELADKANLAGKVRDLASMGYLTRVGKGMSFYGSELQAAVDEWDTFVVCAVGFQIHE